MDQNAPASALKSERNFSRDLVLMDSVLRKKHNEFSSSQKFGGGVREVSVDGDGYTNAIKKIQNGSSGKSYSHPVLKNKEVKINKEISELDHEIEEIKKCLEKELKHK